jgi:hypothetical protein
VLSQFFRDVRVSLFGAAEEVEAVRVAQEAELARLDLVLETCRQRSAERRRDRAERLARVKELRAEMRG